ncbi:hypothetical protein, partial [Lentilactobacillus parabuchneri]
QLIDLNILNKFDCGEQIVNDFIRNRACIYEDQNLMSTTIFYDTDKKMVVGFYSISSSIVEVKSYYDVKNFNEKVSMPEENPLGASFPAIEIGWFGVSIEMQRRTIGTSMMVTLFEDIIRSRYIHNIGFSDVIVSALPGAVEFYEQFGFRYLHKDFDQFGQIEQSYPMYLDLNYLTEIYEKETGTSIY